MRDFLLRAHDRATFLARAEACGLLVQAEGFGLVPAQGVNIDHIGPVTVTPGTYSEDGMTMLTPPVMDDRHHVNLRITEPALSAVDAEGRNKVDALVALWAAGKPAETNAGETATKVGGIEWVRDVASPSRTWAGDDV